MATNEKNGLMKLLKLNASEVLLGNIAKDRELYVIPNSSTNINGLKDNRRLTDFLIGYDVIDNNIKYRRTLITLEALNELVEVSTGGAGLKYVKDSTSSDGSIYTVNEVGEGTDILNSAFIVSLNSHLNKVSDSTHSYLLNHANVLENSNSSSITGLVNAISGASNSFIHGGVGNVISKYKFKVNEILMNDFGQTPSVISIFYPYNILDDGNNAFDTLHESLRLKNGDQIQFVQSENFLSVDTTLNYFVRNISYETTDVNGNSTYICKFSISLTSNGALINNLQTINRLALSGEPIWIKKVGVSTDGNFTNLSNSITNSIGSYIINTGNTDDASVNTHLSTVHNSNQVSIIDGHKSVINNSIFSSLISTEGSSVHTSNKVYIWNDANSKISNSENIKINGSIITDPNRSNLKVYRSSYNYVENSKSLTITNKYKTTVLNTFGMTISQDRDLGIDTSNASNTLVFNGYYGGYNTIINSTNGALINTQMVLSLNTHATSISETTFTTSINNQQHNITNSNNILSMNNGASDISNSDNCVMINAGGASGATISTTSLFNNAGLKNQYCMVMNGYGKIRDSVGCSIMSGGGAQQVEITGSTYSSVLNGQYTVIRNSWGCSILNGGNGGGTGRSEITGSDGCVVLAGGTIENSFSSLIAANGGGGYGNSLMNTSYHSAMITGGGNRIIGGSSCFIGTAHATFIALNYNGLLDGIDLGFTSSPPAHIYVGSGMESYLLATSSSSMLNGYQSDIIGGHHNTLLNTREASIFKSMSSTIGTGTRHFIVTSESSYITSGTFNSIYNTKMSYINNGTQNVLNYTTLSNIQIGSKNVINGGLLNTISGSFNKITNTSYASINNSAFTQIKTRSGEFNTINNSNRVNMLNSSYSSISNSLKSGIYNRTYDEGTNNGFGGFYIEYNFSSFGLTFAGLCLFHPAPQSYVQNSIVNGCDSFNIVDSSIFNSYDVKPTDVVVLDVTSNNVVINGTTMASVIVINPLKYKKIYTDKVKYDDNNIYIYVGESLNISAVDLYVSKHGAEVLLGNFNVSASVIEDITVANSSNYNSSLGSHQNQTEISVITISKSHFDTIVGAGESAKYQGTDTQSFSFVPTNNAVYSNYNSYIQSIGGRLVANRESANFNTHINGSYNKIFSSINTHIEGEYNTLSRTKNVRVFGNNNIIGTLPTESYLVNSRFDNTVFFSNNMTLTSSNSINTTGTENKVKVFAEVLIVGNKVAIWDGTNAVYGPANHMLATDSSGNLTWVAIP